MIHLVYHWRDIWTQDLLKIFNAKLVKYQPQDWQPTGTTPTAHLQEPRNHLFYLPHLLLHLLPHLQEPTGHWQPTGIMMSVSGYHRMEWIKKLLGSLGKYPFLLFLRKFSFGKLFYNCKNSWETAKTMIIFSMGVFDNSPLQSEKMYKFIILVHFIIKLASDLGPIGW